MLQKLEKRAGQLGNGCTTPEALVVVVRDSDAGGDPVLRAQIHLREKELVERALLAVVRRLQDERKELANIARNARRDERKHRRRLEKACQWLTPLQIAELALADGDDES